MKFLYKYPQKKYPYDQLVQENIARDRNVNEYELLDTGIFDEDRYWDVFIEASISLPYSLSNCDMNLTRSRRNFQYAKDADDPEAMSIRITAYNRGPDPANLHIIPQLWFKNTWSWPLPPPPRPNVRETTPGTIRATHETLGKTHLYCSPSPPPVNAQGEYNTIDPENAGAQQDDEYDDSVVPEMLFTENDTNYKRLYGGNNASPYVKDAFHDHIIESHRRKLSTSVGNGVKAPGVTSSIDALPNGTANGNGNAASHVEYVNPDMTGTKAAAHYTFKDVPPKGGCVVVRLKLTRKSPSQDPAINDEELFDETIEERRGEADEFYKRLAGPGVGSDDLRAIMRQALGGMMWSKQYYQFIQKEWIEGDPAQPPPPPGRKYIRNKVRLPSLAFPFSWIRSLN